MKVYICCNAGLSAYTIANSVRDAALATQTEDVQVKAYSIFDLEHHIRDADIVLLAPQIGYQMAKAQSICNPYDVPVAIISMIDYGMCNGENVLKFAFDVAKKS